MLDVALKEWSVVCDLLSEGKLAILLRKGGIAEEGGAGRFRLEYPRFALFPSWAHQKPQMIKPEFRERVQVMDEPAQITFRAMGEAAHIWQVPSPAAFDRLDNLHCWTKEQIDMRFDYKPQNPLYLVAVRCRLLARPKTVENDQTYGGCRSWVPLRNADVFDETGATAVLTDSQFRAVVQRVEEAFAS